MLKFPLINLEKSVENTLTNKLPFKGMILKGWDSSGLENPYKTMSFDYEANTIRALGKIIRSQSFSKRRKPVYWCSECKSALAEAEVEYYDKESKAIDFSFQCKRKFLKIYFH